MMSLETWFWIAHVPVLVGWIALIVLPADRAVPIARWGAAALAIGYAILFFITGPEGQGLARNYSLNGVESFFASRDLLLLGWIHILCFDLFVGSWEAEEAERLAIPKRTLIPCLLLTFLLGPLGLLAFFAARAPRMANLRQGRPGN
jgi:hypothetical protein